MLRVSWNCLSAPAVLCEWHYLCWDDASFKLLILPTKRTIYRTLCVIIVWCDGNAGLKRLLQFRRPSADAVDPPLCRRGGRCVKLEEWYVGGASRRLL